jgi:hypothetical protein
MMANSNAKNTGATKANSTTTEPRRWRRNRRNAFRNETLEAADADIEESLDDGDCLIRKRYLKLIVEVFREIEAAWPVPFTAL